MNFIEALAAGGPAFTQRLAKMDQQSRSQPLPPPLIALLNKTEPGYIPYAFMVPTRIIRVIASTNFCTFRVEQLIRHNKDNMNPKGAWTSLSTHGSETPGMMLNAAMTAGFEAQNKLRSKLANRIKKKRGILRP